MNRILGKDDLRKRGIFVELETEPERRARIFAKQDGKDKASDSNKKSNEKSDGKEAGTDDHKDDEAGGPKAVEQFQQRIKGSVQLIDGLFIGDKHSSIDGQYIRNNQIKRIVNTISGAIKNIFDPEA